MRRHLPLLLLLLAALAGTWLVIGGEEPHREFTIPDRLPAAPVVERPPPPAPAKAPPPAVPARPEPPPREAPAPQVADPRTLPQRTLVVRVVGPDEAPLPAKDLRIYVDPRGSAALGTKLGLYEPQGNVWRFERVPEGKATLRVQGDHVVAKETEIEVLPQEETEVSVALEPAGAIHYEASLYDATKPETVRLELKDAAGDAFPGWFQERSARRGTSPKRTDTIDQGPEGVVFGLLPGRYTLRATNTESLEWDEARVDVEAGRTSDVTFSIRR